MTLLILTVVLVALVAAVIVVAIRTRRGSPSGADDGATIADPFADQRPDNDPRLLRVGDVVNYGGADWIIRGSLFFDQQGFRWQEHLIDNASGDRAWLCVEDDEGLELVLYRRVQAPDLEPGASQLLHADTTFTKDESGRASFEAQGATGTARVGIAEYHDYTSTGSARLSFERFGDTSWEVSLGTILGLHEVDVFRRPEHDLP